MDKRLLGLVVRGDQELSRGNFEKAELALTEAGDFLGARRLLSNVFEAQERPEDEVTQVLIDSYQNGDLRSLPWIVDHLKQHHKGHPSFKQYKKTLENLVKDGNPQVLGALAKVQIYNGELKDGVRTLTKAVLAKDPSAMTFLAFLCIDSVENPEIFKLINDKKYMDLSSWPVMPAFDIRTEGSDWQPAVNFIASLLDQGEDQLLFLANRATLLLGLRLFPAYWISEQARKTIGEINESLSHVNDPDYLFHLSVYWLQQNVDAELEPIARKMAEFGLEDLFLEVTEEVRADVINQSLFELEEGGEADRQVRPYVREPKEFSALQDAQAIFGRDVLITELIESLQSGEYLEYDMKSRELIKKALSGIDKSFEAAAQLIRFILEKSVNFSSYNKYHFYQQSRSIVETIETLDANSSNEFCDFLVNQLVDLIYSNQATGDQIAVTVSPIIRPILLKNLVSSDSIEKIRTVFANSLKYWTDCQSLESFAAELAEGSCSDFPEYSRIAVDFYADYYGKEMFGDAEDCWALNVLEAVEDAFDNDDLVKSKDFRNFVLSLLDINPHFGCQLLYVDIWLVDGIWQGSNMYRANSWILEVEELNELIAHGKCDNDDGIGCLGIESLVALHFNASSEILEELSMRDHYDSIITWGIAKHHNSPDGLLSKLARSTNSSWRVLGQIRDNPDFAISPISKISPVIQSFVAWAVASNPNTPSESLDYLSGLEADSSEWKTAVISDMYGTSVITIPDVVEAIKIQAKRK